ncbi:multidrug effflux MFS transporter [Sphingomicrobium sp. XHP0239]|uniref:multidrug effflux MFS transporter n=1 Tax=Sphingomicrobium maritimum TaxID=3133972 RepID=UPI0031CC7418
MHAPASLPTPTKRRCGEREIVALLAGLMAMNALALDTMLPALPAIGAELGIVQANAQQYVIVAYMMGFGASQLFWGPLADRYGRKRVLTLGISGYIAFGILAAAARDFTLLIAARFLMGACGSVSRILVLAIVRDLYEGERMARVMSLTYMVFMVVPVVAPSLGQLILLGGNWRLIFWMLVAYGVVLLAWGTIRLPETLKPEFRRAIEIRTILEGFKGALIDRLSIGYTLALGTVFLTLVAYLASVQQIVGDTFGRPEAIGWVFAAVAAPMSLASWGNSRIVERIGLRTAGHGGLVLFLVATTSHFLWHMMVGSTLLSFTLFMSAALTAFAFTTANFGTLAMTNMAPIAGTASSVQGAIGTVMAAVLGLIVGQAYDGTVGPFVMGLLCSSVGAMAIVLWTERGRLFAKRDEEPPELRGPVRE